VIGKFDKCPNCGSKKGVRCLFKISGHGEVLKDFDGNIIREERNVFDDPYYKGICCLECGCKIDKSVIELKSSEDDVLFYV
jgi:hypothetical protein